MKLLIIKSIICFEIDSQNMSTKLILKDGRQIKIVVGTIIEYYKNGKKKYEGESRENKRNGQGIFYYKNGNKHYEGEWKDDKRNGQGIFYDENGNKLLEGEWKDGKFNEQGIQYDICGNIIN